MDEEALESLRRRVAARKRKAEAEELRLFLYGRDQEIDISVIYVSTQEIADRVGVDKTQINSDIRDGKLKAIKTKTQGNSWAVHPDDADEYADKYQKLRALGSQLRRAP